MTSGLDLSLDDIIKNNKKTKPGRSSRPGPGPGPVRRFSNRSSNRPAPYTTAAKAPESSTWQHDMFTDQQEGMGFQGRPSTIETGTKLYVSNLDYGVSNEDIKELFSEVGDLKRCSIHYDRSGRSKGTADVVYTRRADALAAIKRYNNVQLDGKPMKIEIVGTNISTAAAPALAPVAGNGTFGNGNGAFRGGRGRGGPMGRTRGGRGGGRGFGGGGRGRRRKDDNNEKISADDLDADLDKYHSQAMETN